MSGPRGLMKGTMFEIELSLHFKDEEDVVCLPNVEFYSRYLGRPTEVDRILITPNATYFVEQKAYNSVLRGNFEDEYWIGMTGRTLRKLYNPIMQNFEHIRSARNQLYRRMKKKIPIENYVVVPDSCKVEHETPFVLNISNFLDKVWMDISKGKKQDPKLIKFMLERVSE